MIRVGYIQSKAVRNEIASVLGQSTTIIESWIRSLAYTRNLCAHHSRLWNRWFVIPPMIPKNTQLEFTIDGNCRFRLIAFVIFQLLEKITPKSNWKVSLSDLFEKNEKLPGKVMGFEDDWRADSFWNI